MFELVLRIGFSLLVVFGLMWGLAKVARRGVTGSRGTGTLSVLNRQQLTRGAAVTVVQVADRALILGVTDQQVNLLGETELAVFQKQAAHPHEHRDAVALPSETFVQPGRLDGSVLSPRTWRSTMDFLRDRTTRR
ncbi:flagellar biosynthetic protein FliO [Actinoplanes sp. NPDC051470]|uniref:FliO/MopB family protein n=1 Tax=unclassified Actinoplanes TaxID=2626549 RepID=UPI003431201A